MAKVTIRLSDAEWRTLRRLAEAEGRSMNRQVAHVVREYAAKKGIVEPSCRQNAAAVPSNRAFP